MHTPFLFLPHHIGPSLLYFRFNFSFSVWTASSAATPQPYSWLHSFSPSCSLSLSVCSIPKFSSFQVSPLWFASCLQASKFALLCSFWLSRRCLAHLLRLRLRCCRWFPLICPNTARLSRETPTFPLCCLYFIIIPSGIFCGRHMARIFVQLFQGSFEHCKLVFLLLLRCSFPRSPII